MPRRNEICSYFNATVFRSFRERRFSTRASFAAEIGVSRQAVDAWETRSKKPTWKHLMRSAVVLDVPARSLIQKSKRYILDCWEDALFDYLLSPPEVIRETKLVILSDTGRHENSEKKRGLKLSTRQAIELTEKLGYFDRNARDKEHTSIVSGVFSPR